MMRRVFTRGPGSARSLQFTALTNAYLIARLSSFNGAELLGWIPSPSGLKQVRLNKDAVRSILKEAGRNKLANCRFVRRGNVGYLVRPTDPPPPVGNGKR